MRDERVSKMIAETSASITCEMKRDSSAMKTPALLTMVFLPRGFVAYPIFSILDLLSRQRPFNHNLQPPLGTRVPVCNQQAPADNDDEKEKDSGAIPGYPSGYGADSREIEFGFVRKGTKR